MRLYLAASASKVRHRDALLRRTDLRGADLRNAQLNAADLTDAVLFKTNLDDCDLTGAKIASSKA